MSIHINELISSYKVYIDSSSILDERFILMYNTLNDDVSLYTTLANIREIVFLSRSNKDISKTAKEFISNYERGKFDKLVVEDCDLDPGVHADIYVRNRISISRMHSDVFLIAEDKGLRNDVYELNYDQSVNGYKIDVGWLGNYNTPWIIQSIDYNGDCNDYNNEISFEKLIDSIHEIPPSSTNININTDQAVYYSKSYNYTYNYNYNNSNEKK